MTNNGANTVLKQLQNQVDCIIASSVLAFIPKQDLTTTMQILASLLKPNSGILVHTDWPWSEIDHPNGFNKLQIETMYESADLQPYSIEQITLDMGGSFGQAAVWLGIARRKESTLIRTEGGPDV